MRSVIYARFSTDLQNERSIDDQIALCRDYARRENLEVIATYEDRARSGSSILGRDGLLKLIDDAKAGQFEIVIVEALDCLSRDMEDLAGLHKRLTFLDIQIRAVFEGQVNTILVGLRGLIGQLYREDNAHKVRRGLSGRIREGLSAGGIAYGCATVPGAPGERSIVDCEAAVVRRIFEEYVAGRSPREIARGLNRDGIPAPNGRAWNGSTINGNPKCGSGILFNEAYIGRLVWNRCQKIKDPDTGKPIGQMTAARGRSPRRQSWQSYLASCSSRRRRSNRRQPRFIRAGNRDRVICCLGYCAVAPVVVACPLMDETNPAGSVSAAADTRRALIAPIRQPSILQLSKERSYQG